ncbi:MAG: type II toxin-antitoxin system HicB family antitoxin [Saprospiraceae bacterium]|nr:type II toxin-antitoxin system HicB family antitoxin [Saprospiraceae bacterium]
MTDKLRFKDFIGSVHFSSEDEVFYGRIEGINDLVTFEGSTVNKLKKAFREAVEDYLNLCKEAGKEVFKSFKGTFNVRLNPELHSKAFEHAILEGKTLNQFVKEAIEQKLKTG